MPDDKPLSGPLFVAVGEDALRCFSRDGRTWTNIQTGREGELYSTVAFGKGRCVAGARFGGQNTSASTLDGATWKTAFYDAKYTNYIQNIVFFNERFLGLGQTFVMPSDDGLKWEPPRKLPERKMSWGMDPTYHRFAIGNGSLVAVANFGVTSATKDGFNWTLNPNPKAANTLIDVAFGNGIFVGGGMHGLRMRSIDGLVWTDRVVGEEGEHINAMVWDGKQFVGIGQGGTYLSPDGLKWDRVPNRSAPTTASFLDGVYIGSLWQGKLMRSTDGISWERVAQLPQHAVALRHGVLGKA